MIKVLSDVNYRVKRGRKKFLRHFNRLKPFIDRHDDPSDVVDLDNAQVQLEAGTVETEDSIHSGDECNHYDIDIPDEVTQDDQDIPEDVARDDPPGNRIVPAGLPGGPGDGARVVDVPAVDPVMREGGKLWCNIDQRNVVEGRRKR